MTSPYCQRIMMRVPIASSRDDVTGAHYSLHDGTHHTWPIMTAWAAALEAAIAEADSKLDRRALAREYGEREYRIWAKPGKPLAWTGEVLEGRELEEFNKKRAMVRGRVVALGVPDDEDE